MNIKTKIEIARFWLETQNFMELPHHLEGKFTKEDLVKIFLEIRPSKLGNTDFSTISNADLVDYIDKLQSMLHKEAEISLTERQLNILEEQKNIQKEQKEMQNKQNEIISEQTKIIHATLAVYTLMAFTMFIQIVADFYYNRNNISGFDQIFAGLLIILFAVIFTMYYNTVHKAIKLDIGLGDKIAFVIVVLIFLVIIGLYIFSITKPSVNNIQNEENKILIPNDNSSSVSTLKIIDNKINNTILTQNKINITKINKPNLS